MKKWLKSKICESVNSAHHCSQEKSNISAQKVKKKKKKSTEMQNVRLGNSKSVSQMHTKYVCV